MIEVWGRATSSNVQPVVWTCEELGIAYDRKDWGGKFGGMDDPDFRAFSPMGLVPAIRDGGLTMFESAAIVRYLGAAYGAGTFWPEDPVRRGALDQWAEWAKGTFIATFGSIFMQMVRMRPENRDDAIVGKAETALKPLADIIDRRLADGPYLGGDDLTFADAILGGILYRYFTLEFDRAETPNLRAYYDRLGERPAYAAHVMVSYESLRPA